MTENNNRIGIHHSFDADLAIELKSVRLAVIVHMINKKISTMVDIQNTNKFVYTSISLIDFPYLTIGTLKTALKKLILMGLVEKKKFPNYKDYFYRTCPLPSKKVGAHE